MAFLCQRAFDPPDITFRLAKDEEQQRSLRLNAEVPGCCRQRTEKQVLHAAMGQVFIPQIVGLRKERQPVVWMPVGKAGLIIHSRQNRMSVCPLFRKRGVIAQPPPAGRGAIASWTVSCGVSFPEQTRTSPERRLCVQRGSVSSRPPVRRKNVTPFQPVVSG